MMTKYIQPIIKVCTFSDQDVVRTSGVDPLSKYDLQFSIDEFIAG